MKIINTIWNLLFVGVLVGLGLYIGLNASPVSANSSVTACALILKPVCGINGVTYDNSCFAQLAGVPIAHTGACGVARTSKPSLTVAPRPTIQPIPIHQPQPSSKSFPYPSWWTQPIPSMLSITTVLTLTPQPITRPFPQSASQLFPYPPWWTQPIPTM